MRPGRLLAGSGRLNEIERRLKENQQTAAVLEIELKQVQGRISVLDHRIEQAGKARARETALVAAQPPDVLDAARDVYPDLAQRLGRRAPTEADGCPPLAADMTAGFQRDIDRRNKEIGGYAQSLRPTWATCAYHPPAHLKGDRLLPVVQHRAAPMITRDGIQR